MNVELKELIGKTLKSVTSNEDAVHFITEDGEEYKLYHEQDCCEGVSIDDICGDLNDLIGSPILMAEEVSNEAFVKEFEDSFTEVTDWGTRTNSENDYYPESYTWTFYKFATIKGYVDIRWFGESNGYYSESVDFHKKNPDGSFGYYYAD